MTMPFERTRSVIMTKGFLEDLLDPKKTPRVPGSVRKQALYLLRHYPTQYEMEVACENDTKSGTLFPVFRKDM